MPASIYMPGGPGKILRFMPDAERLINHFFPDVFKPIRPIAVIFFRIPVALKLYNRQHVSEQQSVFIIICICDLLLKDRPENTFPLCNPGFLRHHSCKKPSHPFKAFIYAVFMY